MAAAEETVLERQAKMREKAKQLKDKREQERQEYVQEKLKEQWRYVCKIRIVYNYVQDHRIVIPCKIIINFYLLPQNNFYC